MNWLFNNMRTAPNSSQMALLPEQLDRLARVAAETGKAIGISQDGSVVHVDTGMSRFSIDAKGDYINPPNQETLC